MIPTGAGDPHSSRGRGWPLKFGREIFHFAEAGEGLQFLSQKFKHKFNNHFDYCWKSIQQL